MLISRPPSIFRLQDGRLRPRHHRPARKALLGLRISPVHKRVHLSLMPGQPYYHLFPWANRPNGPSQPRSVAECNRLCFRNALRAIRAARRCAVSSRVRSFPGVFNRWQRSLLSDFGWGVESHSPICDARVTRFNHERAGTGRMEHPIGPTPFLVTPDAAAKRGVGDATGFPMRQNQGQPT